SIIVCLLFSFLTQAQVSKTVNIIAGGFNSSGGLSSALTVAEKSTITNLTIKGTINYWDFWTIKYEMKVLAVLDLSGVSVLATELEPANQIRVGAFSGMNSLTSVILPAS